MALTAAQLTTLGNDIAANTNTAPGTSGAIKDLAHDADNAFAVAAFYNLFPASDYFGWRDDVPIGDVYNTVTWANYTPQDPADSTVLYQNRALLCQTKQMNLQLLLQGRTTFDAGRTNLRTGLNDATTSIPSGAGGINKSGGWANILPNLSRKLMNGEKVFAFDDGVGTGNTITDPRGASTNPDGVGYKGLIDPADIRAIWGI